jgi:hypothetical protein
VVVGLRHLLLGCSPLRRSRCNNRSGGNRAGVLPMDWACEKYWARREQRGESRALVLGAAVRMSLVGGDRNDGKLDRMCTLPSPKAFDKTHACLNQRSHNHSNLTPIRKYVRIRGPHQSRGRWREIWTGIRGTGAKKWVGKSIAESSGGNRLPYGDLPRRGLEAGKNRTQRGSRTTRIKRLFIFEPLYVKFGSVSWVSGKREKGGGMG